MEETRIFELWNRAVDDAGDVLYPQIITRFAELIIAESETSGAHGTDESATPTTEET